MNANTGALYESMEEALNAGERGTDLVEITGTQEQVEKISAAVKAAREADPVQRRKGASG
jgi:heptaprenylglyceryl phosphate synthase